MQIRLASSLLLWNPVYMPLLHHVSLPSPPSPPQPHKSIANNRLYGVWEKHWLGVASLNIPLSHHPATANPTPYTHQLYNKTKKKALG